MQDNNYTDLANEGWDRMQLILDDELPLVNRKRRPLLLLILLFGLAGISFASYSFYTKSDLESRESEKSKVELLQNRMQVDNTPALKNEIGRNELQNEQLNPVNQSLITDKLIKNEPNRSVTFNINKINKTPSLIQTVDDVLDNGYNPTEVAKTSIENFQKEISKEEISKEESASTNLHSELLINKPTLAEIMRLQSLPLMSFDLTTSSIHNTIPLSKTEQIKAISLYVDVSYGIPVRSHMFGSRFAIGLEKPISRRWNLDAGAGISYNKYNSNIGQLLSSRSTLDAGEVESSDPVTYIPDQAGSVEELLGVGSNVKSEYYDFVANKLNSLLFLDIPVSVSYKLNRKSSFGLGLQYSYLMAASNDKVFGISANLLSNAEADLEESAFYDYDFLNKYNFSISGRYEYRLNRNFASYISFEHGIRNIIKTTDNNTEKRYKSQVNLGIRYSLKM